MYNLNLVAISSEAVLDSKVNAKTIKVTIEVTICIANDWGISATDLYSHNRRKGGNNLGTRTSSDLVTSGVH